MALPTRLHIRDNKNLLALTLCRRLSKTIWVCDVRLKRLNAYKFTPNNDDDKLSIILPGTLTMV